MGVGFGPRMLFPPRSDILPNSRVEVKLIKTYLRPDVLVY
jgi:hypothetical protein